jgi:hypothetical protein
MPGHFKAMKAALVALVVVAVAACGESLPSPSPSPPVSPSLAAESPSPTPSPAAPLQRLEKPLPAAIEEAAAAATDVDLYMIGGFDAAGYSLRSVYVFDGTSWKAGPRLPLGLDHSSAATLDGRVYVAGGHSVGRDTAQVFRLDGSNWTELAPLHHARGGHALIADGGRLYAIGGNTVSGQVPAAESYDPAANRWSDLPSLRLPRNHVSGFTFKGNACVAGGRSPNTARVDCFDPVARTWVRLSNLPQATSGAGATTFKSGLVVVAGGEVAGESKLITQAVHLDLDGRWGAVQKMLVPRHGFQLAVFQGRAWACGGGSAAGLHPVATCTSVA